jgi:hypothetical protein
LTAGTKLSTEHAALLDDATTVDEMIVNLARARQQHITQLATAVDTMLSKFVEQQLAPLLVEHKVCFVLLIYLFVVIVVIVFC